MDDKPLIHLDNNYLTNLLNPSTNASQNVRGWMENYRIGTSAIAWMEFLRGPEDEPRTKMQIALMKEMLASGGISPFGEAEADSAAYLFCQIGRPKNADYRLRMDCLIAASAITTTAQLATDNICDFEDFARYGLNLCDPDYML
ncbi:MAG TPA: PIN domain-containing protein [Verrucomicrobiae bacterium]|jgi:predicted nucleic acid-binding protein